MATIINASNSTGLTLTSDLSGVLQLQQNGVALPALSVAPAFSAYQNNPSQALSAGVVTKVTLNTEEFDTNNNFDSTTNYRFTPTVAGYYQINGQVTIQNAAQNRTNIFIYKNGSVYKTGASVPQNGTNFVGNTISCLLYLNGSTDYVELWVLSNSATNLIYVVSTSDSCWFNGYLARGV